MFKTVKNKKIFVEILDQIKELLITKQLILGQKIPSENELSQSLGISRSSLREALKVLEILGIIEAKAGEGTVITKAEPENVKYLLSLVALSNGIDTNELFEVRTIIEVYAAKLASLRRTDEDLLEIHRYLKDMDNTVSETQARLDFLFHRSIVKVSKNNFLIMLMEMISDLLGEQIKVTRETFAATTDILEKFQEQHWAIYKAIEAQNPQEAEEAVSRHFTYAQAQLGTKSVES